MVSIYKVPVAVFMIISVVNFRFRFKCRGRLMTYQEKMGHLFLPHVLQAGR